MRHVIEASRLLRDYGFKVHYHWMPGLPGSSPELDLELSRKLFADPQFRPDGLKLYPTLVIEGTELERWYRNSLYQPYAPEEMVDLLLKIKSLVPRYVRISRLMRDIPSQFIVAGCQNSSLRQELKRRMKELGVECQCIRCREYGHRSRDGWIVGEPQLQRLDYEASAGREIFLSFEDERGTLFGLLRMRVCSGNGNAAAVVRELHVFGPEVALGNREAKAAQHRGLGKALLAEAERIARQEFQAPKLRVLSGVGARDYYRSECDYSAEGAYMVKALA